MALPKTFTGGERLFAGDLNDNFDDLENSKVASADVNEVIVLTQSAYDGLTPSSDALYVIVG